MKSLIEIKKLRKIYSDNGQSTMAVDSIDLQIKEGEYVAIIGPSGSGKSTLLQILGCLDRPTSGSYLFAEKEVSHMNDDELAKIRNQSIGFVFQSFNLLPRLSVIENVKMPLVYADMPEDKRDETAMKFVDLVGLSDRANYQTLKLSGGQKQRVAIARALVNSPKIILADEPTGSLDSKSGAAILDFLDELNKNGHTIVIVTHESYVAQHAKRILHIKDGLIEKDEAVSDGERIKIKEFMK